MFSAENEKKLHEKTRAAAAPRNPKKGAVSSPLKPEDIFSLFEYGDYVDYPLFRTELCSGFSSATGGGGDRIGGGGSSGGGGDD